LDVEGTDVSVMDRFILGEKVAELLSYKIKAAVVWPENDITKFAETVASNRGGKLIVVGNEDDALKWLLADKKIDQRLTY
jgi:hypothetical protein